MTKTAAPVDPDPRFNEFIEKSQAIAGEKIAAAIPGSTCSRRLRADFAGLRSAWRCTWGHRRDGRSIAGIWSRPCVVAGLGGWGLHCIGHDCGHGSFSRNRRLNFVIGHLSLLPLLYPFHAWRHVHNLHHAHTNSLELDTDWAPIPEAVYRRMSVRDR